MFKLTEVPSASRFNLQPAEHLLFCKHFSKIFHSAFSILGPQVQGGGAGIKPSPWAGGGVYKISSRSVPGFGFPLALHIPVTSVPPFIYIYIDIKEDRR